MMTHQILWLERTLCLTVLVCMSMTSYGQCDTRLLDDSSFCNMWREDSVGLTKFRNANYLKLVDCYMKNDTLNSVFTKIYRSKLLDTLGRPNEIRNLRNKSSYCSDWWQEYIYYVDTASEIKYNTAGENTGTYISFVFDQCEKYLVRISYGFYQRRKDYR